MVAMANWSHETVLAAEPRSAALARDFVCLHLVAHRLPHLVEDVRLVVSELATNAVSHAQTPFVVTLSSANGSVLLDIQDGSTSAPIRSAPDVMDMSGRGLMIVELLSQEWGTRTDAHGFKSVWASFSSGPSEPELLPSAAR
jgi:anti-sigma regulatory factor (Ser/Thr protein kinase)